MLRKIRIILAVLFLLCITLLFLDFSGTVQPYFDWMAKLQFLPSVLALSVVPIAIVLALTLLLGRLYCSVICPTGVLQDFFAWIGKRKIFRSNKKTKWANNYSYSKPKTWLRITVLVSFIVVLVAGFNAFAMIIAPYSAYGRIVSAFLQPLYIDVNNMLATWAEANGNYTFYAVELHNNPIVLYIVAGLSALLLFVLAFMNGRTYCNTICPVGTVLGFVSKYSVLKMNVDENKCVKCGVCAKNCKAACINVKKDEKITIDYSRCVACGDCEQICGAKAMSYGRPVKEANPEGMVLSNNTELSRRSFLSVLGVATVAATVKAQEKTTDGGFAVIKDKELPKRKTPITPPGSLSARHFQQHCTSCQLCVANCPNGVLRPNTSLERLLQPVMEYDKGYCSPECTRCSDVCPTGAIRPITVEVKAETQIGHAVWIRKNCLPATDGIRCGNCAKHCPVGAIQMVPMGNGYKQNEEGRWVDADGESINPHDVVMIPVIDAEKCIGCGSCENLCPSRPFSAIYVEGHEVHKIV